jgi:hypothetical protein
MALERFLPVKTLGKNGAEDLQLKTNLSYVKGLVAAVRAGRFHRIQVRVAFFSHRRTGCNCRNDE